MKRNELYEANKPIDFTNCNEVFIPLGGAMPKTAILYEGDIYMLKFQEDNSKAIVSEYLSYKIASALNIPCQEVLLGVFNNIKCCAIRFMTDGISTIHSYREINDSSVNNFSKEVSDIPYNVDYIVYIIMNYKNTVESIEDRLNFFQIMCYFDALIDNFDRHWGNWGLIGTEKNYRICPLFDNGSSIFPRRDIKQLPYIISNIEELLKRVYDFPTSQIRNNHNNKKMTYFELIQTLREKFGNSLLIDFCNRFDTIDISNIIYDDKLLNYYLEDIEKEFIVTILNLRFDFLLKGVLQ